MGKRWQGRVGSALVLGGLLVCGPADRAVAGVDVGISINIGPPPIVVAEPPEVVPVPGTEVVFVPGVEFDVFFYNGWWWSPRGDRWYRCRAFNGPWKIVERRLVPRPVIRVPRDYRSVYVRERRIPYGQWKKERDRHRRAEPQERREEHRERGGERERGEYGRGK